MVRMYVRRVIFKKLAGTEIDFFVFLLSTRSSSIKSLSVENNMVMAIWSYHGTWYHGTSTNGTGTLYHKNHISK